MNEKKPVPVTNAATGKSEMLYQSVKSGGQSRPLGLPKADAPRIQVTGTDAVRESEPVYEAPMAAQTAATDQAQTPAKPPKAPKQKREMTSVAQFVEYAYSRRGQRLALPPPVIKQMAEVQRISPDQSERLLDVSKSDKTLAVPRQLLFAARELSDYPVMRGEIREFVRKVFLSNPLIQSCGLEALVQNLPEGPTLSEGFARLGKATAPPATTDQPASALSTAEFSELCSNAIACLAVWAADTRGTSLAGLSESMFNGVWSLKSGVLGTDTDKLRALTDAHTFDALGVACSEFKRRADESQRAQEIAQRAASSARDDAATARDELAAEQRVTESLRAQLAELTGTIDSLQAESATAQNHLRDDLMSLRAGVLRRLKSETALLGEGLFALRECNPPKVEVMVDHANRVVDSLKREITKLEQEG